MFINHLDVNPQEGIYELNIKNSITQKVGKFYAENPFPNYKIDDTKHTIQKIGDNNLLMKELKRFVGFNKSLLSRTASTSWIFSSIDSLNPSLCIISYEDNPLWII